MNNTELALVNNVSEIINSVEEYISSNEDWVFYFLNPIIESGTNKPLEDCVKEHPNDWNDYVTFTVINLSNSFVQISINIDDNSDDGIELKRYIHILTFEDTVSRNKKLFDGKFKELKMENIKESIMRIKQLLSEKEKELSELEKEE
jgi:hypothetical protein